MFAGIRPFSFSFFAIIALLLGTAQASANIMTFKDIDSPSRVDLLTYQEDGITAAGFSHKGLLPALISFGIPETLNLVDGDAAQADTVMFTMGSRFDANSFDLIAGRNNLVSCDPDCEPIPYDDVKVTGFREGSAVAELNFYMGDPKGVQSKIALDGLFENLDMLWITVVFPDHDLLASADHPCSPCSDFNIDNVRLDPVPVPPAFPFLAAGLAMFGFAGWRRRRRAAAV